MNNQKTDVKKILALKKAGWRTERIAAEMKIEPSAVDKAIHDSVNERGKGTEKKPESKEQKSVMISLDREELTAIAKEAAEIGARTALETMEEEKKKLHSKAADRRLHNTKLLLRNYRMLKDNCENSVFGKSQMEESAADILCSMMNLYDDEVIVDAIKRSATRTAIMVMHIDTMISLYQTYCVKSANNLDARRYEVIYDMYIAEETLSVKQIAKKQNMSRESVYIDIKIAIERLSALIFGVDGLSVR